MNLHLGGKDLPVAGLAEEGAMHWRKAYGLPSSQEAELGRAISPYSMWERRPHDAGP